MAEHANSSTLRMARGEVEISDYYSTKEEVSER